MKIKMQMVNGSAVFTTKTEKEAMEQVIALLKNPDVLSVTILKQTEKR